MIRTKSTAGLGALALAAFMMAPGCGDDGHDHEHVASCDDEPRAEAYVAGLEKVGTAVKVQLTSVPAPPAKGDNTWTILVTDLQDQPLDGLTIDATPFMPDHGHGTPLQETVTPGTAAGEYVLAPVNLWMPGFWEVTLDLTGTGPNGAIDDQVTYLVCIDG
jgi:hypothetical protein